MFKRINVCCCCWSTQALTMYSCACWTRGESKCKDLCTSCTFTPNLTPSGADRTTPKIVSHFTPNPKVCTRHWRKRKQYASVVWRCHCKNCERNRDTWPEARQAVYVELHEGRLRTSSILDTAAGYYAQVRPPRAYLQQLGFKEHALQGECTGKVDPQQRQRLLDLRQLEIYHYLL